MSEVQSLSNLAWRRIQVGTHRTVQDLISDLEQNGYLINNWALDMLAQVCLASSQHELELRVVSVEQLGFPEGAEYDPIRMRVDQLGLQLCPAEVAPQLRRQYPDQPRDEEIHVWMTPLKDSFGRPCLFSLGHYGYAQPWLCGGGSIEPGEFGIGFYNPKSKFVFL